MDALFRLLQQSKPWLVITGAGISLNSGIPTYRDDDGNWLRSDPIKHQEFINFSEKRKRYWARSAVGWPPVAKAQPNENHHLLAQLEAKGLIGGLITQNVDRLHQRAGHQQVIDLHGRLDRVRCLHCNAYEDRTHLQQRLLAMNPFLQPLTADLAPDGDAYVEDELTEKIVPVDCQQCGGHLMPDVVFFGGAVPQATHRATQQLFNACRGVMAIGSSLMVYSGYRFCKMAKTAGKPLLIINRGKTRADDLADLKIDDDCQITLKAINQAL